MGLSWQEISFFLQGLNEAEQVKWMLSFGFYLTLAARMTYDNPEAATQLRGFNEIQNDTYARIRDVRRGHHWPIEEWFGDLMIEARTYKIEGDFGWAVMKSIETFKPDQQTTA